MDKHINRFGPWLIVGSTLILWEACVLVFAIPKFVLPAPSAIIESLVKWAPVIAIHAWQTLFTRLIGFVLAVLGGLGIGIAVGWSTLLYRALYPLLIAFNSVPKVAIVPILVIWFGLYVSRFDLEMIF